MIHLYAADIRHLKDPKQYSELLTPLEVHERKAILALSTSSDRIEALGSYLLLKEAISRSQNSSAEDNCFTPESFHFCFSYDQNIMICALGDTQLGCDIKKIKNIPKRFPAQFLNSSERSYLSLFNGDLLNQEFHRLWTIKESYIKMTDEVFASPAKELEVSVSDEISILKNDVFEDCRIEEYSIPGYRIAVCAKTCDFAPDVKLITII